MVGRSCPSAPSINDWRAEDSAPYLFFHETIGQGNRAKIPRRQAAGGLAAPTTRDDRARVSRCGTEGHRGPFASNRFLRRLTVKRGSGAIRDEIEIELTPRQFRLLWTLTKGRRLKKIRHRLPRGRLTIELDIYGGKNRGLKIAEVEFASAAASRRFGPEEWMRREVTGSRGTRIATSLVDSEAPSGIRFLMAFELDFSEEIGKEFRRVIKELVDESIGLLRRQQSRGAIHETRKNIKKLRAALRLLRPILDDEFTRENRALRDAGRQLSDVRDAEVLVQSMAKVGKLCRTKTSRAAFRRVRARLAAPAGGGRPGGQGKEPGGKEPGAEVAAELKRFSSESINGHLI